MSKYSHLSYISNRILKNSKYFWNFLLLAIWLNFFLECNCSIFSESITFRSMLKYRNLKTAEIFLSFFVRQVFPSGTLSFDNTCQKFWFSLCFFYVLSLSFLFNFQTLLLSFFYLFSPEFPLSLINSLSFHLSPASALDWCLLLGSDNDALRPRPTSLWLP